MKLTKLMKNPKSTCLEKMKFVKFWRTSPLGNKSGTQLLERRNPHSSLDAKKVLLVLLICLQAMQRAPNLQLL